LLVLGFWQIEFLQPNSHRHCAIKSKMKKKIRTRIKSRIKIKRRTTG